MNFKYLLREKIAKTASYVEIFLAVLVLFVICLCSIQVVQQIFTIKVDIFDTTVFNAFLANAFNLVIGIEFVKMLTKHSPGAAIEVVLYAIARQLIIGHYGAIENLVGIITIALIFVIRKYLFVHAFGQTLPGETAPPQREAASSGRAFKKEDVASAQEEVLIP
ncbi:MAG: transporter [Oscillospiraceae bacterium]|nr:transporter [Oscillospiraceae bacterium]